MKEYRVMGVWKASAIIELDDDVDVTTDDGMIEALDQLDPSVGELVDWDIREV